MATELANAQTDRSALKAEGQIFEISKAVFFEAAHFMGGTGPVVSQDRAAWAFAALIHHVGSPHDQ